MQETTEALGAMSHDSKRGWKRTWSVNLSTISTDAAWDWGQRKINSLPACNAILEYLVKVERAAHSQVHRDRAELHPVASEDGCPRWVPGFWAASALWVGVPSTSLGYLTNSQDD